MSWHTNKTWSIENRSWTVGLRNVFITIIISLIGPETLLVASTCAAWKNSDPGFIHDKNTWHDDIFLPDTHRRYIVDVSSMFTPFVVVHIRHLYTISLLPVLVSIIRLHDLLHGSTQVTTLDDPPTSMTRSNERKKEKNRRYTGYAQSLN